MQCWIQCYCSSGHSLSENEKWNDNYLSLIVSWVHYEINYRCCRPQGFLTHDDCNSWLSPSIRFLNFLSQKNYVFFIFFMPMPFFLNGGSCKIKLSVPLRRFLVWFGPPPQPPSHDLVQKQYPLFINKTNNLNFVLLAKAKGWGVRASIQCLEVVVFIYLVSNSGFIKTNF